MLTVNITQLEYKHRGRKRSAVFMREGPRPGRPSVALSVNDNYEAVA